MAQQTFFTVDLAANYDHFFGGAENTASVFTIKFAGRNMSASTICTRSVYIFEEGKEEKEEKSGVT